MNPPIQLIPGDIRQAGDTIQQATGERISNPVSFANTISTTIWVAPRPIAPHTIGRVILPADLMNARFFRS